MNLFAGVKETIKVSHRPIESIKSIQTPEGPMIACASRDSKAYLVRLSNNLASSSSRVVKAYDNQHKKGVTDVVYSSEGDKLITVSADQQLIFWDRTTKHADKFSGHNQKITSVDINESQNKILTGSKDASIILWNNLGQKIAIFDKAFEHSHKSWVNAVKLVPNRKDICVTGSSDGTVKIWDMESNVLLKTFFDGMLVDYEKAKETKTPVRDFVYDYAVNAIACSKDGSLLAYGGRNAKVYLLNLNEGEYLSSIKLPGPVLALAYGENQPLIAVSIPGKVLLFNIITVEMVGEFEVDFITEAYIPSLLFLGDEVVICLENGTLMRLEISKN